MTELELFKKVYCNDTVVGQRISKQKLKFLKDDALIDEVIDKLFVECPTKFPGESKNEKHYLLKRKWQIVDTLNITLYMCKNVGIKNSLRYILDFIDTLIYIQSDWRYYMHPTAIDRHGKLFF